ncbi:MAG: TIGR03668 family PPOX class F420-dependent oxidoreductase [Chloroflexi bacterium]|nr:TIGR03668 family PPOX class F420-dependent oxidoreductase [Chloroflexota bacterium]
MEARLASFITSRRVAHLATADASGRPHVVPICYAFDGVALYSALDLKPKQVAPRRLKRVRNLLENPRVAVLIDDYSEDWSALAYVLVHGRAEVMPEGDERERAANMLREKYPQYRELLPEEPTILKITPEGATGWGRL